jgi:hypothetical protein
MQEGNLNNLGRALHSLQDAFAHENAGAGMLEHLFGNPDDPNSEPNKSRAREAEEATRKAIRDFMRGRGVKPKC